MRGSTSSAANRTNRRSSSVNKLLRCTVTGLVVLVGLACVAVTLSPLELPPWVRLSVYGSLAAGAAGVLGLAAVAHWGRLPGARGQQLKLMWQIVRAPRSLAVTSFLSLL